MVSWYHGIEALVVLPTVSLMIDDEVVLDFAVRIVLSIPSVFKTCAESRHFKLFLSLAAYSFPSIQAASILTASSFFWTASAATTPCSGLDGEWAP